MTMPGAMAAAELPLDEVGRGGVCGGAHSPRRGAESRSAESTESVLRPACSAADTGLQVLTTTELALAESATVALHWKH